MVLCEHENKVFLCVCKSTLLRTLYKMERTCARSSGLFFLPTLQKPAGPGSSSMGQFLAQLVTDLHTLCKAGAFEDLAKGGHRLRQLIRYLLRHISAQCRQPVKLLPGLMERNQLFCSASLINDIDNGLCGCGGRTVHPHFEKTYRKISTRENIS